MKAQKPLAYCRWRLSMGNQQCTRSGQQGEYNLQYTYLRSYKDLVLGTFALDRFPGLLGYCRQFRPRNETS